MVRKIIFFSLFFILIGINLFADERLGKTTKEAVARADSTIFSEKLGKIPKGVSLEVVQEKYGWYKIRLPKEFCGFVYSSYIKQINRKKGLSKVNNLNIRAKPNLEAPIIGRLNKEDEVKIIEKDGDWYKIKAYPYSLAWVNKNSIEIVEKEEEKATEVTKTEKADKKIQEEKKTEVEAIIPEEKEEEVLEEPLASGILKKSGRIFSSINYRIENKNGIIFLKIPPIIKAKKFLNKRVKVWGKFQKNRNYLLVEKILEEQQQESLEKEEEKINKTAAQEEEVNIQSKGETKKVLEEEKTNQAQIQKTTDKNGQKENESQEELTKPEIKDQKETPSPKSLLKE